MLSGRLNLCFALFHQTTHEIFLSVVNLDDTDLTERISNALATIIDGVCRPLNVRMEQTILSGLECSVMNRIDIRIQFYVETLEQVSDY